MLRTLARTLLVFAATSGLPALAADAAAPDPLVNELENTVGGFRKVIVLMEDIDALPTEQRTPLLKVGHALYHTNQDQQRTLGKHLAELATSASPDRFAHLTQILDTIDADDHLFDGDQLAFREPLHDLEAALTGQQDPAAHRLARRVHRDLQAIDGVEQRYDAEFEQMFSTTAPRPQRGFWGDYLKALQTYYRKEDLLREFGIEPAPTAPSGQVPATPTELTTDRESHIFGDKFPPHTIALTFDDGPHPRYTAEVVAILKRYHVPGTFFEIGRNIGTVDASGQPVLGKNAAITRSLIADGYVVGNHSYTHPIMSRLTRPELLVEINDTDKLLKAIDANRQPLFRFPYGAHNADGMAILAEDHLQSVLWNVDSLDWADPIPNSVVNRVLHEVGKEGRGIVLFHDIHDRAPKALPIILNHLLTEGYHFAAWDGQGFSVPEGRQGL